jgi:serine protease Do
MKTRKNIRITVIALFLAIAVAGLGYGMNATGKYAEKTATQATGPAVGTIMIPNSFSDLAEIVRPSVVNIQVSKKLQNTGLEKFGGNPFGEGSPFGDFFGPFGGFGNRPPARRQEGIGSGFIISNDGQILTNNHVVEDADQIKVKLADGKEFDGKIIGRDPKTDLALIKIKESKDLKPLKLGNSDAIRVGSWVLAVGSPFGLEQTVTAGIVSAKGRVIGSGPYDNFIQTDASINPGNSGGPLINMQGEVIGINTAIIASGQGIGFAIPINLATDIASQLQKHGRVTRGLLGVTIQDITPELAKSLGLDKTKGALVSQVLPGESADKAGMKQGDVIVNFDGRNIENSHELPLIVAGTKIGKETTVTVIRDGKELKLKATIGEMEDEKAASIKSPGQPSLGVNLQTLTPQIARELGIKQTVGVVVTGVESGSPADQAGIKTGDVIGSVNRKPVKNASEFAKEVERVKKGESLLLLIHRGQSALFVAVPLR